MYSIKFVLACSVAATACTCPEPYEYWLYPELPAAISVCPCETEIWLQRMYFEQFLRKEIFILWLAACEMPFAVEYVIHQ